MGTNNGNVGKKGISGRKSAYQEKLDAEFLHDIFLNNYSADEIQEKLKSRKYSVKDIWLMKLLSGNERMVNQLVHKLFPDKVLQENTGGMDINITNYNNETTSEPKPGNELPSTSTGV